MDVFIEKLVAKRKDIKDYLIVFGAVFGAVLLFVICMFIPIINSFGPILAVLIGYGAYRIIISRNIEFEYIVTNGDLDIDVIISKRKRKRIFGSHCKEFEIVAKVKSSSYDQNVRSIKNRIEAISSIDADNVFFATLNYKGKKTVVFFEPDERMMNSFRTFIPRKIQI